MNSWTQFAIHKHNLAQQAIKAAEEFTSAARYGAMQARAREPWPGEEDAEIKSLHFYVTEQDMESGRCC